MPLTQVQSGMMDSIAQYNSFKNRIINGAMVIDQRNNGASVTPANGAITYTVDRFAFFVNQASKLTVQQNAASVTPPVGFRNYLGVTSSSAYSVGAGDRFLVFQYIEGFNVSDLAFGTANAAPVTLSFWVRSSLTGTFGGSLKNSAANRSYPFTYTISAANTWEQKSITIAGDTTGTWLTTNGTGIQVVLGLGVGTTYSGTAGAWAAGDFDTATGSTSVVGTNGATFYLTGVQLEKGSTATSFDYLDYGRSLMQCQRYCVNYTDNNFFSNPNGANGNNSSLCWNFSVPMRAAPTASGMAGSVSYLLNTYPLTSISLTTNARSVTYLISTNSVGNPGYTSTGFLALTAGILSAEL